MSSIAGRVLDFARREPGRVFAHAWDASGPAARVTYGSLVERAAAIAVTLEGSVSTGDVVVVIVRPGADLFSAWLAPLLAGAIPSIFPWPTEKLDPGYYERTVASLLRISGARALVTSRDLEDVLAPLAADAPELARVVFIEDAAAAAPIPMLSRAQLEDAEAVSILQHSSGSTGLQKGIALSSRAVLRQIEAYGRALKVSNSDRVANWMPLYHDGGLIAGFLQPLLRGLELAILSPIDWVHDPSLLLRAITHHRSTLCWLPNFAYNFMAAKIPDSRLSGIDLSSMRAFVNTAEPVRLASHELFRKRFAPLGLPPLSLTTSYGTAENTLAITQSDPDSPVKVDTVDRELLARDGTAGPPRDGAAALELLSSGTVLPNTQIRVLGPGLEDMPDRRVGEFAIRSDCMLTGYFHRPDLTAQAFHDGWYLTGDYGYRVQGEVYVTGRKRDLLIVGGVNIYPQDLESIADGVAGVHPGRTVAFGVESETAGTEEIVVLVEAEAQAEPAAVADAVRREIARRSDCVARTVRVVPPMWLLKTSSGKISRTRCREKFLAESGAPAP
jgi:fatty-acyl-CoA synthase